MSIDYVVASLPALSFGAPAPISWAKFAEMAGDDATPRLENGLRYLPFSPAVFACRVVSSQDLGSHTLFVAEVEDAKRLNDLPPATYAYYQSNIKPAPAPVKTEKTVWRCKVCGYTWEGETLPPDFECPLCHHGPEDFEKISG